MLRHTTILLDAELDKALSERAKNKNCSKSAIVRECVSIFLSTGGQKHGTTANRRDSAIEQ